MARRYTLLALVAGTTCLSGCVAMGSNVKGSFSCVAPDGMCAPSSTIDDRALALISGADGDRMIAPIGTYTPEPAPAPSQVRGFQTVAANTGRTQEKVLRIVFPAHIDGAGRLHEQTAVHAVVAQGDWREAAAMDAVATTRGDVATATGAASLLAAVEKVDLPIDASQPDPDLPSAAMVEAARAKASAPKSASAGDPVGAIKDGVAAAIAKRRTPPIATSQATETRAPATPSPTSSAPAPTVATTAPVTAPVTAAAAPAHATPAGRAALAAVRSAPVLRVAGARTQSELRDAAQSSGAAPVVRAANFPAIVGGDR